jgi:hypothetical protein
MLEMYFLVVVCVCHICCISHVSYVATNVDLLHMRNLLLHGRYNDFG